MQKQRSFLSLSELVWARTLVLSLLLFIACTGTSFGAFATGQFLTGTNSDNNYSSVAIGPSNTYYGAWKAGSGSASFIKFATFNGTTWTEITSFTGTQVGTALGSSLDLIVDWGPNSIRVDSAGNIHVTFAVGAAAGGAASLRGLAYGKYTAATTSWTFQKLFILSHPNGFRNVGNGEYALELDASQNPHVIFAWSDVTDDPVREDHLQHAFFNGTAWNVSGNTNAMDAPEIDVTPGNGEGIAAPDLVRDSAGNLHCSYVKERVDQVSGDIAYAMKPAANAAFNTGSVVSAAGNALITTLVVDSSGFVSIGDVFRITGTNNVLNYRITTNATGSFVSSTVQTFTAPAPATFVFGDAILKINTAGRKVFGSTVSGSGGGSTLSEVRMVYETTPGVWAQEVALSNTGDAATPDYAFPSFIVRSDNTMMALFSRAPSSGRSVFFATGTPTGFGGPVATAPTVTTPTSTAVTTSTATLGGNVTSDGGATITARGVVLSQTSLNNNPVIGGANVTNLTTTGTTGIFTVNASSLTAATGYSFKAYATNSVGTTYTSPTSTFTTLASLTPSITNAATNEDTQTTSGLVITSNAGDGGTTSHYKITGITNGSLFQSDGTTAIANNAFITKAQGTAGLKFTPTANFSGTGSFTIQASTSNVDGGLGGSTVGATITVNPIADTPGVTNATTSEDVQTTSGLVVSRNGVDGTEVTHFKITSITNGTLFQNNGTTQITANSFITFAQANAGLKFTPTANFSGTGSFQVQASTSNGDAGLGGSTVTASITVNAVADTPNVTNATTPESTQTTSGLVVTRNAADGAEVTHFKITSITNGTLFQNNGTTQITANSFITFAQANAGLKFTPTTGFSGTGSFQVQSSLNNTDAGLGGSVVTASITVNAVAGTPSVTNATTNEDVQTTSGLVVSRNVADGAEVTHFKITSLTNGSLFQNDGTTAIANNAYITFAQANAGLKFTPGANFFGTGSFQVQASTSNSDAGLGGSAVTASITVNAVADTPGVTNSTTGEDTQTTSGLVVTRNAADGAEVTHFKITSITNGALFQNDGTTSIASGNFITFAQANAGLKFTPNANFSGAASFQVQASTSNADGGLGGSVVTATITVNPLADTPGVTNATTNEDAQTTSGLVVSRNIADGAEVTHFKITSMTNGALFLNDGLTSVANGAFITFAQANAGLKFTPSANFFGNGSFNVQASGSASDAGLGGAVVAATITVNPIADTAGVTNATTNENVQTTSGLVISRNAADGSEVTHFKITSIINGTLFLNDGVTSVPANSFLTFAQANAGLKFTPSAGFFGVGSFQVQASLSAGDAGLGGGIVTATITVNAVAETPSVTNATSNEDVQTTSGLVVSRNAADGAEVTHFKITGITNGTLFLNDGFTAIAPGSFLTFAQVNAGLKFTPAANFFGTGSFNVQASVSNSDAGLGGGVISASITVSAVADTPSVSDATTPQDTQSASGLVISRSAVDGAEVTHFKIAGLTNGTLYLNDGTTEVAVDSFITAAQGGAGLKFTPAPGFRGNATFNVQASLAANDTGLGGGIVTATISVNEPVSLVVSTASDVVDPFDGLTSLREAIAAAAGQTVTFSDGTGGTVNFQDDQPEVITLNGGQVNLTAALTIQGPGANKLSISGNHAFRVFSVTTGGSVTFSGLTIRDGLIASGDGAGILINGSGAAVNVTACAIVGNNASSAASSGGGIYNDGAALTIRDSTISGNTAASAGGGVRSGTNAILGSITVLNSTITGNSTSATGVGGGISTAHTLRATNCTIVANAAGSAGNLDNEGGLIILGNTIVAGGILLDAQGLSPDIAGSFTSEDYNLIQQAGVSSDGPSTHNLTGVAPALSALADNGGPTQTMAPVPSSPAINAGGNDVASAAGLTTDQRGVGFLRVFGASTDIGAFEAVAEIVIEEQSGTPLVSGSATIDYGTVSVGSSSGAKTFTISNPGLAPLTITSIATTTGQAGDFTVDLTNTGTSVDGQSSTSFTVVFAPSAGGARSTTLQVVTDDADEGAFIITLNGIGNALPVLTLPTSPLVVEAANGNGAMVNFTVTAVDPEDGPVTPTISHASGSTFPLGDTMVTVSATDSFGGTANGSFIVRVQDTTDPTIAAPPGGFRPRAVFIGTVMPDFAGQAIVGDAVSTPLVTQAPLPGSATTEGTTLVTLTATDGASNMASIAFNLTVRPFVPFTSPVILAGQPVPGAGTPGGPPAGATLVSFGPPAIDEDGVIAFTATFTGATGKGSGLFTATDCLALVGAAVPGVNGATYQDFKDPIIDGGRVVTLTTLAGVPATKAAAVFTATSLADAVVLVRAGDPATPDGATFKRFKSVEVRGDVIAFTASLNLRTGVPKVTNATDEGVWVADGAVLTAALREGQQVGTRRIKSLVSFDSSAGSRGQGRGWLEIINGAPTVQARVVYTDKIQGIVSAEVAAGTVTAASAIETGTIVPPAFFVSGGFGLPIANEAGQMAILAATASERGPKPGVQVKLNGDGFRRIAARSEPTPVAGTNFGRFQDPVLSADGGVAFSALITGTGARKAAAYTLWWQPPGNPLTLLARGGGGVGGAPNDLPTGVQWNRFTSLAIAANRGPLFTATLVVGRGGVTKTSANAAFATDSAGRVRRLFGPTDSIDLGGGATKTLKTFTLLTPTVGNAGATRSFNDSGVVVWLATFTDKTTAIITTEVP